MELIPTQEQPVVDGVPHKVDAGPHDECDDAEVDRRTRQHLRTALHQLNKHQYVIVVQFNKRSKAVLAGFQICKSLDECWMFYLWFVICCAEGLRIIVKGHTLSKRMGVITL